jgi:hypothetical protein
VGVRFHSLVTASPVLDFCRERGLTYDSSLRLPEIVEPFRESRGILRVPFELSDAQILYDRDEIDPKDAEVRARVYAFHPQLVFLNCELLARYNDTKPVYRDYAALKAARNMGPRFGARDLLKRVIEFRSPQAFSPLREVVAHA